MDAELHAELRTPGGDAVRAHLAGAGTVLAPGVWDPLSARLAAAAGFPVLFVSGFAAAAGLLGVPDIGLLTQTEMADVARRVRAAVPDLPVVVDADTGYGDAANAARTATLWEASGASGLFLEDQVWPKRCGHLTGPHAAGKEVVPIEDWLAKLRAVLAARTHLHVTARTDARSVLGLDAALERARRAADLGVDALFVEAPRSVAELEAIAAALAPTGLPLVANVVEQGRTPLLTAAELADLGFRFVVSPLTGLLAAVRAAGEAYTALRADGGSAGFLDRLARFDEVTTLVGLEEHLARRAAAQG